MALPRRILVHRNGELGEAIVALPALWVLRSAFPDAHVAWLARPRAGDGALPARELLGGSGLVDEFLELSLPETPGVRRVARWARALWRLRSNPFDALAYLAPSDHPKRSIVRDESFFRLAGIRTLLGMQGFPSLPPRAAHDWPQVEREADLLLTRLANDGLPAPPRGRGCMELCLDRAEDLAVERWLAGAAEDGGRPWLAVAPGSRMPAKVWPSEHFAAAVAALIERFDVWPVVFGGPEDRQLGDRLTKEWGRGHVAAGPLRVRPAAAALARCVLFVGNDGGAMHLAAAVGVPCVAIFTARDWRGRWTPYGQGHCVLMREIPCQGCGLTECLVHRKACLERIEVSEVIEAAAGYLERQRDGVRAAHDSG